MDIKGLPDYAMDFEYLVAELVDGEVVFYAVCANGWAADELAATLDCGVVIHNFLHGYRKKTDLQDFG